MSDEPTEKARGVPPGLPPLAAVRQRNTHRLIPARFAGESVLTRIADDDVHLQALFELEQATNDRRLGEQQLLPGIGVDELVFGVPYHPIVNAAFCHAHPLGSRFNGPERGAWYAAFEVATAKAEVAFHKTVELAEVNWWEEAVTYVDFIADVGADLHDLRPPAGAGFEACLAPQSYEASQKLARDLLAAGSQGVVYPSVRRAGGTCIACFRPAIVQYVRRARRYEFRWNGRPQPVIRAVADP